MADLEKVVEKPPLWNDPKGWTDLLRRIESFIDFKCDDPGRGYRELKEFAESQLARIGDPGRTPIPSREDSLMPERTETPTAPGTVRPISKSDLDELLVAVVDDPHTWLSTPSKQLGGRRPGDLIGTVEEAKVVRLLQAVDQGLF